MSSSPKRMSLSTLGARIHTSRTTVERQTQTENRVPRWKQLFYCLVGDENYRKQRQREAARDVNVATGTTKHINSVSYIDQAARVLFPASFAALNLAYWMLYGAYPEEFGWKDPPSVSH